MYIIMYDGTTVLNSKFTSSSPFYGLHRINQSHYCYVQSEILLGGGILGSPPPCMNPWYGYYDACREWNGDRVFF